MATAQQVQETMDRFYGGSEGRTRHFLNRKFIFTEGVSALADVAGAYWLLDIIATEVAPLALDLWVNKEETITFFKVEVLEGSGARLWLERDEGEPALWEREIEYTDFPQGTWTLYLCIDGVLIPNEYVLVALLPTEY